MSGARERRAVSTAAMSGARSVVEAVLPYAGAVGGALAFALVPFVLVRRREPSSALAWILALIFLPRLGAVLFLLHGRDRVRWPARRKRAADRVVIARLHAVRNAAALGAKAELARMPINERRIFSVCAGRGTSAEISSGN